MSHYIKKCRYCLTVLEQCRCYGPKQTTWGTWSKCEKEYHPPAPDKCSELDPIIADLRAKLELFRGLECRQCGVAPTRDVSCYDCSMQHEAGAVGACVSVGMRALCGRRIFDG